MRTTWMSAAIPSGEGRSIKIDIISERIEIIQLAAKKVWNLLCVEFDQGVVVGSRISLRTENCFTEPESHAAIRLLQAELGPNYLIEKVVEDTGSYIDISYKEIKGDISLDFLVEKILDWGAKKKILANGTKFGQSAKLIEEASETLTAVNKGDILEIQDGIGDVFVTITLLARMHSLSMRECVTSAYEVIKNREGEMINGTFVKNSQLEVE